MRTFSLLFPILAAAIVVLCSGYEEEDGDEPYGGGGNPYGGGSPYGGGGGDPYGGYGGGGYGGGGGGGPPPVSVETLSTSEELKVFLSESAADTVILGFFDEATNKEDMETFQAVVSKASSFKVGISTSKAVLEDMKFDGSAVVVYPPAASVSSKYGEKTRSRYPSKTIKADSLEKFIYDKALPIIGEKSHKTIAMYDRVKLPLVTVFADSVNLVKNEKQFNYFANRVRKVAMKAEFKGKFVFCIASKSDYAYELTDYGLSLSEKSDVGVGIKLGANFYKMTDAFGIESLEKFLNAYNANTLTPKMKTAPASTDESSEGDVDDSAVVHLTDANFDAEVKNSDKDILIEFYAPWCGHCKALKPQYATAAKRLSHVPSVKLAAMDATANTVPAGFEVQGYPTLFFLKGGDMSQPMPFEGAREADSIVDFVQLHASTKFTL